MRRVRAVQPHHSEGAAMRRSNRMAIGEMVPGQAPYEGDCARPAMSNAIARWAVIPAFPAATSRAAWSSGVSTDTGLRAWARCRSGGSRRRLMPTDDRGGPRVLPGVPATGGPRFLGGAVVWASTRSAPPGGHERRGGGISPDGTVRRRDQRPRARYTMGVV